MVVLLALGGPFAYAQRGGGGRGGEGGGMGRGRGGGAPPTAEAISIDRVEVEIHKNAKLEEKVQGLLPSGLSLGEASAGFKTVDQFVSALYVSKDLKIQLNHLKAYMVGKEMSLAKSIQAAKPEITKTQAEDESRKAEKQAKEIEKSAKS
jgi:hypothetical protein